MPEPRIGLVAGVVSAFALALACGASGAPVPPVSGLAICQCGRALVISSLEGGDKTPLTPPLARGERRWDFEPAWSPDGTRVAFARWTPSELALMVIDKDGTDLQRVAGFPPPKPATRYSIPGAVDGISWSPDGTKLAFLLTRWVRKTDAIYSLNVNATGSGAQRIATAPRKPFGYLSLFGWSPDSSRVSYSFTEGEPISLHYTGPAWLKMVSADGSGRTTVLTEDALVDASWAADGTLTYVRHCAQRACQLAVRHPGAGRSRGLTHFTVPPDFIEWDSLDIRSRPESSDIVYAHGRTVYDLTPSTEATRRVVTLPCPFRHCVYYDNVDQGVFFVGITQDGRFALLEYGNWARDSPFTRDYSLDLETGAITRIHLVTSNPAQIYLP